MIVPFHPPHSRARVSSPARRASRSAETLPVKTPLAKTPLAKTLRTGTLLTGALLALAACAHDDTGPLRPLPATGAKGEANPRTNTTLNPAGPAGATYARIGRGAGAPGHTNASAGGDIVLNFAGTDIHAVVDQILGTLLHVNYAIDPAVQGNATLHTAQPLTRAQLLPTLRVLLAGAHASLITQDGLYRIVPTAGGGPGQGGSGDEAVPLRYANAEQIAKLVQPVVQNGGHVTADPGSNTLILSGDPATRATLRDLVESFDTDMLSGQSYLLLPVNTGTAEEMSRALETALNIGKSTKKGASGDALRIFAMPGIDSILVVARQPRLINDARRAFSVLEAGQRQTSRGWSVFYLHNGRANDVAYVLQQAFTPNHVTARPTRTRQPSSGMTGNGFGTMGNASSSSGSMSSNSGGLGSALTSQTPSSTADDTSTGTASGSTGSAASSTSGNDGIADNPLLGGLGTLGQQKNTEPQIRIIPDLQNNSVLIYGTHAETAMISGMLNKIDIMPLQVRVDATVAEVTLNDTLQYGTQFFFKSGGINGILSSATQSLGSANLASSQLSSSFPGFVIGGSGQGGAPFVINALQSVTKVRVLSSPELMVVDNQPASLMVGNLVPYLTGATTSVLTSNSTITNSINYQPTGVILQITPHVSNTGMVTLDISQQVSSVSSTTTSTGSSSSSIDSPTFSERQVTSRVAISDGQTVGLAGLITENASRGNQGLPWLKDIPILGFLASQQTNTRSRTELLVLITPHVIHNQDDARAMTEDLRRNLSHAALVAPEMQQTPATGSPDPQARALHAIGLHD